MKPAARIITTSIQRLLCLISCGLLAACSSTSDVTPPQPHATHETSLSRYGQGLLTRAGVSHDDQLIGRVESDPELLGALRPAERDALLAELYLTDTSATNHSLLRERYLRAAHHSFHAIQRGACASGDRELCGSLLAQYHKALLLIVSDLIDSGWSTGLSPNGAYDLQLNGDGGTIDIREWTISVPSDQAANRDATEPEGVTGVACQTEPSHGSEPLYTNCLPIRISASFEDPPASVRSRAYITASEIVPNEETDLQLSATSPNAPALAFAWSVLDSLVRQVPMATDGARAHLGCIGEVDRSRLTALMVIDKGLQMEPWAEISSSLSLDSSLRDRFNFCTYTEFSDEVTPRSIADLTATISQRLAPQRALLLSPRAAKVAFITQGQHSGEMVSALRQSAKRLGQASTPAIETTGVFALSPHLFNGSSNGSRGDTPTPLASVAVATRDIHRLLTKVIEQQAELMVAPEEEPDFTLSPVM